MGEGTFKDKSFQQMLYEKKMKTHVAAKLSGSNFKAAEDEAQRQIKQTIESGDAEKGTGVTKSGKED